MHLLHKNQTATFPAILDDFTWLSLYQASSYMGGQQGQEAGKMQFLKQKI